MAFANLMSQNDGLQSCYALEDCQGLIGEGMLCDTVNSTYSSVYDCPGYRLPTGAEWEYAARAGTKTTVYSGEIIDTGQGAFQCYDEPHLLPIAWYCANAGLYTHPVGQKLPNGWGLYDIIGNAAEWTSSVSEAYGAGPFVDWGAELQGTHLLTPASSLRQVRGGGFSEWPNTLNVGSQGILSSAYVPFPSTGLRLVQTLK
jgi:formylglycine-generating enzyme required for sulfatase activity